MHYIGIDLGTSAVKLLLVDGAGAVLKSVSKEYAFDHTGTCPKKLSYIR